MIIFSPTDVKNAVVILNDIPQDVFDAVNELLVNKFKPDTGDAILYRQEILNAIIENSDGGITVDMIFDNNWMDIKNHYRAKGWTVRYRETPHYTTNDSWFIFEV